MTPAQQIGFIKLGRVRALVDGHVLWFGPRQWQLFTTLLNAHGRVVLHGELMQTLYGDREDGGAYDKILQVFVVHLRKKLEPTRFRIDIKYRQGYFITRISVAAPLVDRFNGPRSYHRITHDKEFAHD